MSPGAAAATGNDTIADWNVVPLLVNVTWRVALPALTLNGTWNSSSLATAFKTGANCPFTRTEIPLQEVGTGVVTAQSVNLLPPRFEPLMNASMPGASGPAACDAAFNT